MLILADDESEPTIQCSKCRKWHHRHCVLVLVGSESPTRSFTCPNCPQTKSNGESSHVINRLEILTPVTVRDVLISLAELKRTDLEGTILMLRKSLSPCPYISLTNLGHELWAHFQPTEADLAVATSLCDIYIGLFYSSILQLYFNHFG
jgi:PHD-finger